MRTALVVLALQTQPTRTWLHHFSAEEPPILPPLPPELRVNRTLWLLAGGKEGAALFPSDLALLQHLRWLCASVRVLRSSETSALSRAENGGGVVFVSASYSGESELLQRLADVPLPLVALGPTSLALGLGGGIRPMRGAVQLSTATHPLAAELARGLVPLTENPTLESMYAISTCGEAIVVAHAPLVRPADAAVAFGYEAGTDLRCSGERRARRAQRRHAVLGLGASAFVGHGRATQPAMALRSMEQLALLGRRRLGRQVRPTGQA